MQLAVCAIGPDRAGLAAALTGVLAAQGCDVSDAQMSALGGRFAISIVADAPAEADLPAIAASLREVEEVLSLDLVEVAPLSDPRPHPAPPSHVVTVTGVDHPGIVHAFTRALADAQANVTDLNIHRVADEDEPPLLAMMLEVAATTDSGALRRALAPVASEQSVEVEVRELDDDLA